MIATMTKLSNTNVLEQVSFVPIGKRYAYCFVSQELLCHECMTLYDCPLFYLPTNFTFVIAN